MTLQDASLFNAPREWRFGLQMQTQTRNSSGEFEFHGVPAGAYTLEVRSQSDSARARIPLIVGGDTKGVRVAVGPPAEVTGRITVEDNGKINQSEARIGFLGDAESADATVEPNYTFAVRLYPGHYHVYFGSPDSKLIIKSIRSEGTDIYQKGLTVSDGSKVALEIVLAADGGEVEGVALDKDDKPAAGATVLLAAADRSRSDSFHTETTDQYGRYHFEDIRPGEYKVFAWEDIEPFVWFEANFLKDFEARGETVTLEAHGHATAQLHVSAH